MKNLFYKLVSLYDNKYMSYAIPSINDYCMEYRINEFVYPKLGKLFVFKRLAHVHDFIHLKDIMSEGHKLFICEATNPTRADKVSYFRNEDALNMFWRYNQVYNYTFAPIGTYYVDGVKLLEAVI